MRIDIYFRDKLIGSAEAKDGAEATFSTEAMKLIALPYKNRGLEGTSLLQKLLETLRGNTHAVAVED